MLFKQGTGRYLRQRGAKKPIEDWTIVEFVVVGGGATALLYDNIPKPEKIEPIPVPNIPKPEPPKIIAPKLNK